MRKYLKIITIVLILISALFILENSSIATESKYDFKSKIESTFNDSIRGYDNSETSESVRSFAGMIIFIFQTIGTGIAIIMLIVIAMKYMIAAPGDRAEIKKHAVVYIVGAVTLFATTAILGIIQNFTKNFNKTP